ncbi:YidB family protein [Crenothrix sp.]|uniref:YidB family protein n=1 Tax=Crenothrix sp. TaxID=3100433 RepID=UPI00374D1BD3
MGLLDSIVDVMNTQAGGTTRAQGNLLTSVIGMLNNPQIGGLSGLLQKLNAGGLTEQVASWVGTGSNLPVSGDQLQAVLGSSFVQEIAAKLGINVADVSSGLSHLLPTVIDKLTPDGQIPDSASTNSLLEQGLGGLMAMLGTKTA